MIPLIHYVNTGVTVCVDGDWSVDQREARNEAWPALPPAPLIDTRRRGRSDARLPTDSENVRRKNPQRFSADLLGGTRRDSPHL